jgi:hypothetical protein
MIIKEQYISMSFVNIRAKEVLFRITQFPPSGYHCNPISTSSGAFGGANNIFKVKKKKILTEKMGAIVPLVSPLLCMNQELNREYISALKLNSYLYFGIHS